VFSARASVRVFAGLADFIVPFVRVNGFFDGQLFPDSINGNACIDGCPMISELVHSEDELDGEGVCVSHNNFIFLMDFGLKRSPERALKGHQKPSILNITDVCMKLQ
jgi:hypothetical protein